MNWMNKISIWQADVAHWIDFVGGPIWWCNNSKMADGRHFGFRFWAIISASINIFSPNLVPGWKISSPRRFVGQKSGLSKIQDGGRPPFGNSKCYYNSVVDWDIFIKFCMLVELDSIMSVMSKIVTGSKFKMAGVVVLNFVLGHKFGVRPNEIFRTEFDTVMEFQ